MTNLEFQQQLVDRDECLDYTSKATRVWTPALNTDIRRTLVANWPEQNRDEVFYRIERQVRLGTTLPKGPLITTHRGGLQ